MFGQISNFFKVVMKDVFFFKKKKLFFFLFKDKAKTPKRGRTNETHLIHMFESKTDATVPFPPTV